MTEAEETPMYQDPEVQEHVREILVQVRSYIDDVAIHMTSHAPNTMVSLRMELALIGLNTLWNIPTLQESIRSSAVLTKKYRELRTRYAELDTKIKEYKFEQIT